MANTPHISHFSRFFLSPHIVARYFSQIYVWKWKLTGKLELNFIQRRLKHELEPHMFLYLHLGNIKMRLENDIYHVTFLDVTKKKSEFGTLR